MSDRAVRVISRHRGRRAAAAATPPRRPTSSASPAPGRTAAGGTNMTDPTRHTILQPGADDRRQAGRRLALRLPYYLVRRSGHAGQVPDSALPDRRTGALPGLRTLRWAARNAAVQGRDRGEQSGAGKEPQHDGQHRVVGLQRRGRPSRRTRPWIRRPCVPPCWIGSRRSSRSCSRRGASAATASTSATWTARRARAWWSSSKAPGGACGRTSPPTRAAMSSTSGPGPRPVGPARLPPGARRDPPLAGDGPVPAAQPPARPARPGPGRAGRLHGQVGLPHRCGRADRLRLPLRPALGQGVPPLGRARPDVAGTRSPSRSTTCPGSPRQTGSCWSRARSAPPP